VAVMKRRRIPIRGSIASPSLRAPAPAPPRTSSPSIRPAPSSSALQQRVRCCGSTASRGTRSGCAVY
jgi:hypothetical protein